ncbi:hypothetical protein [Nocardia africana]|uniref:DUF8020 domain-containing protein n=1 Tax=Nocardia africana TaxID=134964 RepID=A0ABW6NCF1_9NOCA
MNKRIGAVAILAAGLSALPGISHADVTADAAPVNYHATATPESVNIETDSGTLENDGGTFTIKAADGTVLAGAELSFRVDDFVFPISSRITGHRAVLKPEFDLAHATYRPVALPFEEGAPWKTPYDREVAAWNRLTSTIGAGATIATLVGGLAGGAVGCLLGGIAGATVASAAIIGLFGAFVPAAVVGCVGGIVAIGALGTLAGQLLVTAPVAILAAIQYFTTINSPFPQPAK